MVFISLLVKTNLPKILNIQVIQWTYDYSNTSNAMCKYMFIQNSNCLLLKFDIYFQILKRTIYDLLRLPAVALCGGGLPERLLVYVNQGN
jgi:hypothetical protein